MPGPGPQNQPDEAMVDLLVKRVMEGLSPAEQRELDVLDSALASAYLHDFERAAAALLLAGVTPLEPLPTAVRTRLEAEARTHVDKVAGIMTPRATPVTGRRDATAQRSAPGSGWGSSGRGRSGSLGWVAAAACLLLAVFGWLRTPPAAIAPPVVAVAPVPVAVPEPPPTPAQARDALAARAESIKINLGATKDPAAAGVVADVVWDPATQQGYLHLVGLAPNDPNEHQYQAWIFDGTRDKRYPVDGGVFDVPQNATEVVIPIHATVPVRAAAAFAVTIEKSGGVVVSARDRVVLLGQAS